MVLTKADKLGRQQQRLQAKAIAKVLGLTEESLQLVSSVEGTGIADLGESIKAAVVAE